MFSSLGKRSMEGPHGMETLFSMDKDCRTGGLVVCTAFFSRDCVVMVSDKYSKEYYISIVPHEEEQIEIRLARKDGERFDERILREFMNDLLDYRTRLILHKEFGEIRKKIVEYAFSPVE